MEPIEAECVKVEPPKPPPLDKWCVFDFCDGEWHYEEFASELETRKLVAAMRADGVDSEVRIFHCTDQPHELPTKESIHRAWVDDSSSTTVADFVLSYLKGERK